MSYSTFPKKISSIESESLYGYVQRVANFYGWSKLGAFLDVIGVSNIHQINWFVLSPVTERIIDNLAKSMQLDKKQLSQQLYPDKEYSMLALNKRMYGSHAIRRVRVCPLCLTEGTSHKLQWQHVASGHCEKHQCELVNECQHCNSPIQIEYGISCGSCFKSIFTATDDARSILPILTKLSKSEQLELMTAVESVITMLQSDNDSFSWRKFIENTKPKTLANLYFEGFLILTNDNFKDKWVEFIVRERQNFSFLGEKAVNLPLSKVLSLSKPLLRKIKLIYNEQKLPLYNALLPDFSLKNKTVGNVLLEKDITYFCGIRKVEFSSLLKANWLIQPNGISCTSQFSFSARKLIDTICNVTTPLSEGIKTSTEIVNFNDKELDLLKFSGLNKIDLLVYATSKNIPIYLTDEPKDTLIEKLYIMKSDLFDILLNSINVSIGGIADKKLASMLGTTVSKVDVMIKCGFIKLNGNKIDSNSVIDFFKEFEVLNRIGRIKKVNIKKLVSTLDTNHGLRPAFAFKTEKLDVAYIFNKTDKFTQAINKVH
jgi:hypothetical protein